MTHEIRMIKIRDLIEGFHDDDELGCWTMNDKLNVRPGYQRNFCYPESKQNDVIDTIMKGDRSSLQLFNWVHNPETDTYEIIDGQQRTVSICNYIMNRFAYRISKNDPNPMRYEQLSKHDKDKILDYEIIVQIKSFDSDRDKLEFFKRINIAGLTLNDQELRNAAYPGPFITSAKKYFSKRNGPLHNKLMADNKHANDYFKGDYDRQDWLETALEWYGGEDIAKTMSIHQNDDNAEEMWCYVERILDWVRRTFKHYRKEMKGLDYGYLFKTYGCNDYSADAIEKEIKELMMNDEIQNKKGIYYFIFDKCQSHLHLRTFTMSQKCEMYERQEGICPRCHEEGIDKKYDLSEMDADHIIEFINGGKTNIDNGILLCVKHNRGDKKWKTRYLSNNGRT